MSIKLDAKGIGELLQKIESDPAYQKRRTIPDHLKQYSGAIAEAAVIGAAVSRHPWMWVVVETARREQEENERYKKECILKSQTAVDNSD
jgi:hypothetical protein